MTTLAPCACSTRAIDAPTRRAAPVISTALPESSAVDSISEPYPTRPRVSRMAVSAPLPPLSAPELEHSAKLVSRIRSEIEANDGWISFARFMEMALYEPGLGYYSAGATKFGAAG